MKTYDIAVIGGGASGMIAAIAAAQTNGALSIAIVERNARVGKKILTTGNGRCNLTNTCIDISRYHGGNVDFARTALSAVDYDATLAMFSSFGLYPKIEDGKVYPHSLQASSVLDMLRMELQRRHVDVICDFRCVSLVKDGEMFCVSDGERKIYAKRVIVCVGGCAAPKCGTDGKSYTLLKKFGHRLTELCPSLVQMRCSHPGLKAMKGVKCDALVSIFVDGKFIKIDYGELLFTDYGLSGPPIFQLSRIASEATAHGRKVTVKADLMNDIGETELYYLLLARNKDVPVEDFLVGMLNKLCARQLIKSVGTEKFNTDASVLTDKMLKQLAHNIKNMSFAVTGTNGWDMAQVTAGGISTEEFNPSTMESKLVGGLYAAGEMLDIDGDCGGFNLQWAWSSGTVAGESCAKSLARKDKS